jgi:hypothetical protein
VISIAEKALSTVAVEVGSNKKTMIIGFGLV